MKCVILLGREGLNCRQWFNAIDRYQAEGYKVIVPAYAPAASVYYMDPHYTVQEALASLAEHHAKNIAGYDFIGDPRAIKELLDFARKHFPAMSKPKITANFQDGVYHFSFGGVCFAKMMLSWDEEEFIVTFSDGTEREYVSGVTLKTVINDLKSYLGVAK